MFSHLARDCWLDETMNKQSDFEELEILVHFERSELHPFADESKIARTVARKSSSKTGRVNVRAAETNLNISASRR